MSDDAKRWADMERAYFEAASRSQVALMEAEGRYQRALGRRVVQLVARPGLVAGNTTHFPMLVALCSDGTMWAFKDLSWWRIADIPTDE